jgi:hypothetical protein
VLEEGYYPDAHLREVGRIVMLFAVLEHGMASFIWSLLGLNSGAPPELDQRYGQIVTAGLSFRGLLTLLDALFRETLTDITTGSVTDPNLLDQWDQLQRRIANTEEQRNVITHSVWAAGDSSDTMTRIKSTVRVSKGLRHQFQQVSAADLHAVAVAIDEASTGLLRLQMTLHGWI